MPTNVEIYQNSNPVPVKILMPDGMVLAFDGSVVLPADSARALIYSNSNFVPSKWLMPDGSVVSGMPATLNADEVMVSTTNFTNNLGPEDINVQHALETIDQMSTGGGTGYNFIETTPTTNETIDGTSITITGKTMRHSGIGSQSPVVTINGNPISVTQESGEETVYLFSYAASLSIGDNTFIIVSNNGATLTKTLVITRNAVAPSCSLSHMTYMKAGAYTITLITDYPLTITPTLDASIGSLSAFTGSGVNWSATLTITNQNGNGTFSNAVLIGDGGTGTIINSGTSYVVDTIAPVIGTANFSTTLWHYETGAMTCTIAMGENTTGFTGQIDLSNFGLSANYPLTHSGNNMLASFTPARVDNPASYGTNIRVSDRCGNAATPKADTDNQLQVVAYRLALQNLTFPAYLAVSNVLSGGKVFTTDSNSIVAWGAGQTNTGTLIYSTDYLIDGHNKIHLDETKWADTIAANALGLLNVDVYEN